MISCLIYGVCVCVCVCVFYYQKCVDASLCSVIKWETFHETNDVFLSLVYSLLALNALTVVDRNVSKRKGYRLIKMGRWAGAFDRMC